MTSLFSRVLPCAVLGAAVAAFSTDRTAQAHPHVFVDGGVNFVLDDRGALTSLDVIWRYDPFETLYTLSSLEIAPEPDGSLVAGDRQRVSDHMSDWPDTFEGSTHLSIAGEKHILSRPRSMGVELVDGSLVLRFRRHLEKPFGMEGQTAEVAFYEATFFYKFSVTEAPEIYRTAGKACSAEVIPFDRDRELEALQLTLSALGRDETPQDANVGALFADRVVLRCD